MRFFSVRRTVMSILGFVLMAGFAGIMGMRFADTSSAAAPMPPINVLEKNLDASGNIRVHEQGTVPITGTVNVGNAPAVQDVNVTNGSLPVTGSVSVDNFPAATTGVTRIFHQEISPFTSGQAFHIDIHQFSKIRILAVVNGSGTVNFDWGTNGGVFGDFDLDAGGLHTELLADVAGTELQVTLGDPDGEQVILSVFGSN